MFVDEIDGIAELKYAMEYVSPPRLVEMMRDDIIHKMTDPEFNYKNLTYEEKITYNWMK